MGVFDDTLDAMLRDSYRRSSEFATVLILHFGPDMAPAWLNLFRLLAGKPARSPRPFWQSHVSNESQVLTPEILRRGYEAGLRGMGYRP